MAGTAASLACAKASDCATRGATCKASVCTCSSDVPDTCGTGADAACVATQTDAAHCGGCGVTCAEGAACVAGQCGAKPSELLKAEGCGSIRLVVAGSKLYWTESLTGKVRSLPLAGGAASDFATGQSTPSRIVADDEAAYWINQADVAGMSKVMKKLLTADPAAAPETLPTAAVTAPDKISALAVGGGRLFYTLGHDVHAIATDASVTSDVIVGTALNKDVTPPVASGEPSGLALNGAAIIWTTANRQGVERDDTEAGVAGYVELGQSQGSLLLPDVALDSTYGYWANGQSFVRNALNAATPVPDAPILVTPSFDNDITAFAIDANHVYVATALGLVLEHPLLPPSDPNDDATAVPPLELARDQVAPTSLVLAPGYVYWATRDCAIRSLGR